MTKFTDSALCLCLIFNSRKETGREREREREREWESEREREREREREKEGERERERGGRERETDFYYVFVSGHSGNFDKVSKDTSDAFGVGYDYGSVMHYSSNAFSLNGQPTIVAKVSEFFQNNSDLFMTKNDGNKNRSSTNGYQWIQIHRGKSAALGHFSVSIFVGK